MLYRDFKLSSKLITDLEYDSDDSIDLITTAQHDRILDILRFEHHTPIVWDESDMDLVELMRKLMLTPSVEEICDRWLRLTGCRKLFDICETLGININFRKDWLDTVDTSVVEEHGLLFRVKELTVAFQSKYKCSCKHKCKWNTDVFAKYGYLDCLQYAFEQGCDWNVLTTASAAEHGHLDCLKFLHENGCPWDELTTANAARGGHLHCLKYAFLGGCNWDELTTNGAVVCGHLDCLKYAHEQGCPWGVLVTMNAAAYGRLECFKYAFENGCPYYQGLNSDLLIKYIVEGGHLEILKYLHEKGFDIADVASFSVKCDRVECLKYAHQQGCYISEDVQKDAARYGSIECLKYLLHEHLLSINASIIANIALSGNLKCLKYFHEAGFPWDDRVTLYAATQGHLECLQYAHEQGCPWHKDTYTMAKMHDDCLDYAIEHCCPIPPYR